MVMSTGPGEAETPDPLSDLVEALTALGNYLGALQQMIAGGTSCSQHVLHETLEKAQAQCERSASALRDLRAARTPSNVLGPQGLC